jgi:Virulence factor membrane-bound polymerase, C-terminal/O-Antigen ligase
MLYCLGLLLLSLAWLLPGHYYPWTSFQQDVLAAAGVALVALGAATGGSRWPARAPWIAVGAAALAIAPLLQWAAGMFPFHLDVLLPASYLIALALAIVTGHQLARQDPLFVPTLWSTIGLAGIASFGIALVQWMQLASVPFVEPVAVYERVSGNLRQPNQLASLFGLALAAVWGAFETRRIGPFAATLAAAAFCAGMVMTQSRAPWLFAAATVILWALMRRRAALRTPPTAVAIGVSLLIGAILVFDRINGWLEGGQATDTIESRMQPGYRLMHWETLWEALVRQPWTGYGWLQVPQAQAAATLDRPATFEFLIASHNQLLDLLVWNGLPLGLLVIASLAWWSVSRLRQCTDGGTFGLWLALAYLFMHSLVEFPLQYAYFLLPAGLMIGAIESRVQPVGEQGVPIGRTGFLVIWGALTALLGGLVFEYAKLEESVRRARMVEAGFVGARAEAFVPDIHLLDWQREYVRFNLTEPRAGMSGDELSWMRALAARYPSPGALSRLARASALNGQPADAQRALRLLCHVSKEKHCNATRRRWAELAESDPALAAVPFPPTPVR